MIRKKTFRALSWLLLASLFAFLLGCGGGANNSGNVGKSVFLQVTVDRDGDYVEMEMVKDVSTSTVDVSVCVNSLFTGLDPSVAHVNITRYELRFERTDSAGTATPGIKAGPLNLSLGYSSSSAPQCDSYELPILTTNDKIYGPLSEEFAINPATIAEYNCYVKVFGRNLAGQDLTAEGAFQIQCAAYLPHDELIPSIQTFVYEKTLRVGSDWNATWTAFGLISGGFLTDPFGRTSNLSGFDFPVGSYAINTGYLESIVVDQNVTFGTPQLIVGNLFGSTSSTGTDAPGSVTLTPIPPPPEEPVNTNAVSIEEFFASKYNLLTGESTSLTWAVFGEPTQLAMSPSSFSGVPVSFENKNLTFDSLPIIPEGSVLPLLYAYKSSDFTQDTRPLDSPIVVTGGVNQIDPEIQFFSVSHTSVPRFEQVAFFWKITGNFEKVELLPINGVTKDVTGRESYLTPALNRLGSNVFSLIVTGIGGSPIVSKSLTVTVTDEVINNPPTIKLLEQQPSTTILNGATGAFSFQIDDPENQDSSWACRRIAGDSAFYGPGLGQVPNGHGQDTVSFTDNESHAQKFITFEVAAYDDINYGNSLNTQKAIKLITYNTTDILVPAGPTIEGLLFTAGNPGGSGEGSTGGLLPGQDGVISFRVVDPGNHRMDWSVEIIAGDRGGTLDGTVNYTDGSLGSGGGYVTVHYQDDPDTTDDAVVFKITAEQVSGDLSVVAILKVDYLSDGIDALDFAHIALHYEGPVPGTNIVDIGPRISFYLNYNGTSTLTAGQFFADHEQAIATPTLYLVTDIQPGTGDPGKVADVTYERTFISPLSDNQNFGEFVFHNYYDGPGSTSIITLPSTSDGGVSRWYDMFTVEDFNNGTSYNLPIIAGEIREYQIRVRAYDEDNAEESIVIQLQVENSNDIP